MQDISIEKLSLIGYDKINQSDEKEKTVHFFLDDYRFESIYKNPDDKTERLKKFNAVMSPDFSMFTEMPVSLQLYNCFRNRWVGRICSQRVLRSYRPYGGAALKASISALTELNKAVQLPFQRLE